MTHSEFFNALTLEQMVTFSSEEFAKQIENGMFTWEKIYAHLQKRIS